MYFGISGTSRPGTVQRTNIDGSPSHKAPQAISVRRSVHHSAALCSIMQCNAVHADETPSPNMALQIDYGARQIDSIVQCSIKNLSVCQTAVGIMPIWGSRRLSPSVAEQAHIWKMLRSNSTAAHFSRRQSYELAGIWQAKPAGLLKKTKFYRRPFLPPPVKRRLSAPWRSGGSLPARCHIAALGDISKLW